MKQTIAFFLVLISSIGFIVPTSSAQPSSLLTGLHPRPQVSFFYSDSANFEYQFIHPIIVLDTVPTKGTLKAVSYFQREWKQLYGDSLIVIPFTHASDTNLNITIGEKQEPFINYCLSHHPSYHPDDSLTHADGYSLEVWGLNVLLAGVDSNGTFNGVSTLIQLFKATKDSGKIPPLHINDWPDYPIRWVFSTHNLLLPSQISALETIEDSMAAHKLNGLQQNDFKNSIYSVFEGSYPQYFYNVDSLQSYSAKSNVEIIPGVFPFGWSEGILFHDPDIAEGIPTTSSFLIQDDTGKLLTDPNMVLPNGGFENVSNGNFTGWSFYDGPGSVFVDSTTVHSGKYSARCTNFAAGNAGGNCRFEKTLNCQPFHGYHLSVWVKTDQLRAGEMQLLAIGSDGTNSEGLTATQYPSYGTSDWQKYDVVFNTLNWNQVYVYCGVWGGSAGTIWFDDFQVEDAGITNVLRPTSEIPTVSVEGKSTTYVEGKDYATVVDSVMEQNQGSYPWHTSPGFQVLSGSNIHNGDTVQVHFIRPNPVINYQNGDGSTMVCISEDTLYPIIQRQLKLVDSQYHSNKYFMSHDEIRQMNWDSACQSRHLSPGALLADNVKKCDSIMQEVHPSCERFDWSDMFDSLHNAHNHYYLDNGDLSGDWNLIPKDFTIVNWNGIVPNDSFPNANLRKQSLNFFSNLGFSQITSPYYDEHDTKNIRAWRDSMEGVPNMRGMMYTTWANDYSFLTPFADYAWSAGPMIVHEPPNLYETISDGEYVQINANVYADPYDPTDSIVKVIYTQYSHIIGAERTEVFNMIQDTGHVYRCTNLTQGDPGTDVTYQIQATDLEGITRYTPIYTIFHIPSAGVNDASVKSEISIYPNPASTSLTIRGMSDESTTIQFKDILGRDAAWFETSTQTSTFDIQNIPAGIYECIITESSGARTVMPFVKE